MVIWLLDEDEEKSLTANTLENLSTHADSLIDLLVAQCTDLETLFKIARQESAAVVENDFDRLFTLSSERAILGERLESYHRQISDLRSVLGDTAEQVINSLVAKESVRLALEIKASDADTTSALMNIRGNTNGQLARLEQARRHSNAYLNEGRAGGIKCDWRA